MNETPNFDQPTGDSSAEQQAWDVVEKLNQQFPDAKNPDLAGSSSEFKGETKEYQEIGKKVFSSVSDAAKEATGIRDAEDLGEMLQEKNSWNRQIAEKAHDILSSIYSIDQYLVDMSWNNGRDVITGEQTEDSPFGKIEDPADAAYLREAFLNILGDNVYNKGAFCADALILLAAGKDAPVVDANARTLKALNDGGIARFMEGARADENKLTEIQNSPTYKTVARNVQIWRDEQDGRYSPPGDEGGVDDARTSRLYKRIDEIMSEPESEPAPLPHDIF